MLLHSSALQRARRGFFPSTSWRGSTTGSGETPNRSVYVARLRRAFLLRAHPDRFRAQPQALRRQQAAVVQAVTDRMMQSDFLEYIYGETTSSTHHNNTRQQPILPYVLERKDGELLRHEVNLNQSVEEVLNSLVDALRTTSSVSLPAPPKAPRQQNATTAIHWTSNENSVPRGIDHRFDIHSTKGRDLKRFLGSIDPLEIQDRRLSRMDATAAALVVRREYKFSSVDGTGLGWSSASFAVLLRTLVDLHARHSHKFHTPSFYPLRLVWSSEDFDDPLDLYGGVLYLNPASTPIQWLDILLLVTKEKLTQHKSLRDTLLQQTHRVQSALDVRFHKGNSCSSYEYYALVDRLGSFIGVTPEQERVSTSSALVLERVHVTVESAQACRRAILTKEGHVRIGTSMTNESIVAMIGRLSPSARGIAATSRETNERFREARKRVQWDLGLQRVISGKLVRAQEGTESLLRLLRHHQDLKRKLAGNSLSIVGNGQFCHLGDDGSVVVPCDWTWE